MLAHIKDLVQDAQEKRYALGAFNIHNLESVLGVAQAAVKKNSPAIIQVSESTIKYMGLKPVVHIVSTVAKNIALNVPIALHLDHGKTFESVIECIDAGFSSVHIDASHLPLDENIKYTKQVVQFARAKGVWVQGEVGAMVGGHGSIGSTIDIPKADPKEVIEFVKATGVDTIAAAIGTAHGRYTNEEIDFDLLKKIVDAIKLPFILHGGSGTSVADIQKAILNGVNVINIGTDIKVAFCQKLIETCCANKEETDPRNLLAPCIDAIESVVAQKMDEFGSANRAPAIIFET